MIAWEHLQMRGTFKPFTSGFLADLVHSIGDLFADFTVAMAEMMAARSWTGRNAMCMTLPVRR
jgi:hypothetical protein